MTIISLSANDLPDIEAVFHNSFSKDEAPITYNVMRDLIAHERDANTLNIGFKVDDKIVGAIGFSPVYFAKGTSIKAYILAPLAVHSGYQKRGIATKMIVRGKQRLIARSADVLMVYGDPDFYGRYGFDARLGGKFAPPYPLQFPFGWMAMMLSEVELGDGKYEFTCVKALSDRSLW